MSNVPDVDDDDEPRAWECGSCGAVTDDKVAWYHEPFHYPTEDCRTARPWEPAK